MIYDTFMMNANNFITAESYVVHVRALSIVSITT